MRGERAKGKVPGGADEGFLEVDEGFLDLEDASKVVDLLHLVVVVLRRRLHFGQRLRRGNKVGVVRGKVLQVV